MSSDPPLKIPPQKLTLLNSRMTSNGGIESTFSPIRPSISPSPSNANGAFGPSPSHSRLSNGMSHLGASNFDLGVSALGESEMNCSQSSCRTVKIGNVQSTAKDNGKEEASKGETAGKPESKATKKKSTPNKRPASAITIGISSSISPKYNKKSTSERSNPPNEKPKPQPKSPKLRNTTQQNECSRDASASRDTLLDYQFSTTSNQGKSGSRLGSSPAPPKNNNNNGGNGNGANNAVSSAVVATSNNGGGAAKSGQKKLDSFFGKTKKSNNSGGNGDIEGARMDEQKEEPKSIRNSSEPPKPKNNNNSSSSLSATTHESSSQQQVDHSRQLTDLQSQITTLQKQLSEATSHNLAIKNNQTMVTLQLSNSLKQRTAQLDSLKAESAEKMNKAMDVIESLVRQESVRKSLEIRQKLASDGGRLGRLVATRVHGGRIETWEDGNEPKLLKERRDGLRGKREKLERQWNELDKVESTSLSIISLDAEVSNAHEQRPADDLERMEARETIRMHIDEVRRDEKKLDEEERALNIEKRAHVRMLKLVANEDGSKFRKREKLHDRYIPLNILGKGGFSEVWRAYDLHSLQHVAVKIHHQLESWSDAKKENYTKHVSREYEIHREVRHPRIVSLYDVFEIDTDSFATVLECCEGTDLDTVLKDQGRLGERDARAILLQILSGMRYLSAPSADGRRQGIIHYDLKPGNILFDGEGKAKITDFGLSKIVDTEDLEGMELTSQGAGTYWYLPPECFLMDQDVRISNKVDVWSIGVIYFQMLFGRRPFGDGESQDKVLRNQTMLNATEVYFPTKPSISDGAKEFIRACLTYDQMHRPNISQLCEHPYLRSALN